MRFFDLEKSYGAAENANKNAFQKIAATEVGDDFIKVEMKSSKCAWEMPRGFQKIIQWTKIWNKKLKG